MIYLKIRGRIGNQLFMYATAAMIRELKGKNEKIIIEDVENAASNYANSLIEYDLPNVEYVYDYEELKKARWFWANTALRYVKKLERGKDNREVHTIGQSKQGFLNFFGAYHLQDGYIPYPKHFRKNTILDGYFQSPRHFDAIRPQLIETFGLKDKLEATDYPNLKEIQSRNTVCISIKVQHNVGNPMYDVCNMGYYEQAIEMITQKVENPLFFICSDNVDYVKEHLIDTTKYDCVAQDASFPVHISLAVMAQCKHFIIGNTTFGWWAQYLSENPDKIVIAPSRWYGTDVPCDIYQDFWTKIEV